MQNVRSKKQRIRKKIMKRKVMEAIYKGIESHNQNQTGDTK